MSTNSENITNKLDKTNQEFVEGNILQNELEDSSGINIFGSEHKLEETNDNGKTNLSINPKETKLTTILSETMEEEKTTINKCNNNANTNNTSVFSASDSDNETINNSKSNNIEPMNGAIKKRKRLALFDSDEDDTNDSNTSTNNHIQLKNTVSELVSNLATIEDGEAGNITPHNKSFYGVNNEEIIHTTNSNGEIVPESNHKLLKSRLTLLCDSESEDETIVNNNNHVSEEEPTQETTNKQKKKSKSQNKTNLDVPKKMTPKEAAELRKEIQSESQRMVREKYISLPYHKPKSHSLKEFLSRRPKLASAVSLVNHVPPSVAIKMSTEQLEIISKKIKMREKEVKEFYKSESETEEGDDDQDYVPPDVIEANKFEESVEDSNALLNEEPRGHKQGAGENIEMNSLSNIIEKEPLGDINIETQETVISTKSSFLLEQDATVENNHKTPMETDVLPELNKINKNDKSEDHEPTCQQNTESYDFNLEDVEESENKSHEADTFKNVQNSVTQVLQNDENVEFDNIDNNVESKEPVETGTEKHSSKSFTYSDLDREIENYGNEDPEKDLQGNKAESPPAKSRLHILKEKLANIQPKLSCGPNNSIDLNAGLTKPSEVIQLMERFVKHTTAKKPQPKHKVELSIVTVESGGDICKETVAINVDDDEETAVIEDKPGAKLQKLREELQNQMAQRKSEVWLQKAAKGISGTTDHSKDIEQVEDILDEEEEAEMTDEEDYSDEELDDINLKEKPQKKSVFLDQEAVESEIEEEICTKKDDFAENVLEENDELEDNEYQEPENNEDDNEGNNATKDENSNMSNEESLSQHPREHSENKKRVLKRIVQLEDDSDEDDLFYDSDVQKQAVNEHLDSTITADEDDTIPPHQPRPPKTPIKSAISQSKSISDFLTPISFLTSLQNLNSATKSKDAVSPFKMPLDQPMSECLSQKQLFSGSEIMDSQGSMDEPLSKTQKSSSDLRQNENMSQTETDDEPPSTQDLLGICSGEFTGVTQLTSTESSIPMVSFEASQFEEIKTLGSDQDMIISQLLDEEELENFKKKFESPIISISQRAVIQTEEITGGGIIDSDDESQTDSTIRKRKKRRRIQFSDDENSDVEEEEDEEEIDLHDKDLDEEIGYDSEENEINLKEEGKNEKVKLTDFFEAEAELSESEWGSEDEDEKGLDDFEFELGDAEKFDENKVREDLEKIHMRRILDQDQREVKILQELLLEDGELHGTGRQRQFKWKNIDLNDDQTEEKKDNDEIYLDEEENEEQWRKKRHEREMFLKEKQVKSQSTNLQDDLLNHSQLLKIGQKVLQRSESQNNSENNTPTNRVETETDNGIPKTPFSLLNKRGSFLSRGDQVLQRVAEYTRVTAGLSVNSSKTTKNFVFQSASSMEVSIALAKNNKRKAAEGTPNILKKLRLNTTLSPAVKKKLDKPERSKKLFNF